MMMMMKMLMVFYRSPEGGKEDAVSHWERQPQFLFCRSGMIKMTIIMI